MAQAASFTLQLVIRPLDEAAESSSERGQELVVRAEALAWWQEQVVQRLAVVLRYREGRAPWATAPVVQFP
jgi:hypothetical protein